MEAFFNTTHQAGDQLTLSIEKASSQREIIKSLFQKQQRPLSASQVLNILNLNCPITSVRRAITTLKNAGILEKTENKINGMYGAPEYQYKIATS